MRRKRKGDVNLSWVLTNTDKARKQCMSNEKRFNGSVSAKRPTDCTILYITLTALPKKNKSHKPTRLFFDLELLLS